ncbi:hypothetical protein KEJ37_04010 [Candidatus Bathyarchaeota archaeon]|nr:hypothetical protein [Candidatus Bathyarchaeota archaeon]
MTEEEIERIKKIVNACVLEKNVTPELISQKIKEIRNYGKIIVPRVSFGPVISKISQNAGKLRF